MAKTKWMLLLGIALLGAALIIPSAKQVVNEGDTITVDYVVTLEDGTVYYSSVGGEPLKATLGQRELIPGFEEQLISMRAGETKTFTLPPEKAYGNYRPELVGTFDRSRLPEGVEPEAGKQIQANLKDGTQAIAVITSFTDTTVTLDANHPLAGQTLTFQIKLLEVDHNPALNIRRSPANFIWIVLIVPMTGIIFAVFHRRNKMRSAPAKKGLHTRAIH